MAIRAIKAIKEIQQYHSLGTVEECLAAIEKQRTKKPIKNRCTEKTHYKCECGHIFLTVYADGFKMGSEPNYCEQCGQAIAWKGISGAVKMAAVRKEAAGHGTAENNAGNHSKIHH